MIKFFSVLMSILFWIPGLAKNINPDWKEGNVNLESEGYFSGPVFIDTKNDVLLINKGGQIKAYPAQKVKNLQFYDDELFVNRDFISYDVPVRKGVSKKIFLEIVLSGDISIYRKEKNISFPITEEALFERNQFVSRIEKNYIYYAGIGSSLIELKKFKKKILPFLTKDTDEKVLYFKEEHKLKDHLLSHQIIIIDYYNNLQNPFYKGLKNSLAAKN